MINTDKIDSPLDETNLNIAQLNCFNRQAVLESLLADNTLDILILQEPWVNPFTLRVPTHPAWHDVMAYDYLAKTYEEKTRTSVYISKRIASWNIAMLPSGSPYITAVEISRTGLRTSKLRILSVYNPPRHNTGLKPLEDWFKKHNDRKIPTIVGMDANLHHPSWNPSNYHHTHSVSKELIKVCGSAGFKIQSQKHVPTFYPRARGRPTTIDLTWINHVMTKRKVTSVTTSNNYGSDHQMLLTKIQLDEVPEAREHNSARLDKLDKASYHNAVENQLSKVPEIFTSNEDIDAVVALITDVLVQSFLKQGKVVKTPAHRNKAWWDEERLRPLIRERNRARRWMILSGTREATQCYWEWNNHVKYSINTLKQRHWRAFLAKAQGGLTFRAFKYTQTQSSSTVAPLYRQDRTLATDKPEQAKLLFLGTSVVTNECDMSDALEVNDRHSGLDHPE